MDIKEAQTKVDKWIQDYGIRYFHQLTNMALLTEEVGEVARIISRQYGEQSFKEGETDAKLPEEMADVLFVLLCLANQCGIDLEKAFKEGLEKRTNRDRERHRNNPKLKI